MCVGRRWRRGVRWRGVRRRAVGGRVVLVWGLGVGSLLWLSLGLVNFMRRVYTLGRVAFDRQLWALPTWTVRSWRVVGADYLNNKYIQDFPVPQIHISFWTIINSLESSLWSCAKIKVYGRVWERRGFGMCRGWVRGKLGEISCWGFKVS